MFKKIGKYYYAKLSTPIPVRARCTSCGKLPTHYFWTQNNRIFESPEALQKYSKNIEKYWTGFQISFFLLDDPKDYSDIRYYTFSYPHSLVSKLSKNKNWKSLNNFLEFLSCDCGNAIWSFTNRANENKPEVYNRKSSRIFPFKFRS